MAVGWECVCMGGDNKQINKYINKTCLESGVGYLESAAEKIGMAQGGGEWSLVDYLWK